MADILNVANLRAWLGETMGLKVQAITIEKFAGGQSNPTYRIVAGEQAYVLRHKPFGRLLASAHAIDREHRLISALYPAGFPVPRPYGLCLDERVIGAPFYVMELVEGRTMWDGPLPGLHPAERTGVYNAMIDTLAALHAIVPQSVGLDDYGKPGNYFARQIDRWTRQYRAAQTDTIAEMERLIEWLPRTLPQPDRVAIVHGDFRIDNLVFAPDSAGVRAVLDWELSTLGDPLADLAYLLINWLPGRRARSSVAGCDLDRLGIPTREAMIARYCAKTGRNVVPDLGWHSSFSLFRLACIVQGVRKRVADGNASNTQAAKTAKQVPALACLAWCCAIDAGA